MKLLSFISKVNLKPWGAAISITGICVGMYLDFLFKDITHWTLLFMILSIIMLMDWKNLFRLHFPTYSPMFGWVILFHFYMLMYAILRIIANIPTDSEFITYHFYVIALCLSYCSIHDYYNFKSFPKILFLSVLPAVILGSIFCYMGLITGEAAYDLKVQDKDAYNLDMLTVSSAALYALFSLVVIDDNTIKWKILKIIVGIMSLYILLECNKRTPIFMVVIGTIYYLYSRRKITLKLSISSFRYVVSFFLTFFVLYMSVEFIHLSIDRFVDSFYNGVLGLLGDNSADYSKSVEIRIERRQWADNYIENEFGFLNYIFGAGYLKSWLDYPLKQAFIDMGLIGYSLFLFLIVLYPLSVMVRRIDDNNLLLSLMLCLLPMFELFSSGHPYQHSKYLPLCMLIFFVTARKHNHSLKQKGIKSEMN